MTEHQIPTPKSKLKKIFWNWDHSTNWCLNTYGRQNTGVANHYTKHPDEFVKDYTRMIDYCAANNIDAVGCVGLLRDVHGGLTSAQKICAYGQKRGVRVYLIAGLYSYGGIYHEGENEYSLDRFLRLNPQCMAVNSSNEPKYLKYSYPYGFKSQPSACPSDPLVRNFVLDSLAWLFLVLPELGGVQIESGDSGMCMCSRCRQRRWEMGGGDAAVCSLSLEDMAAIYPDAVKVIRSVNKDAWILCENYVHFTNNPAFSDPQNPAMQKLLSMPDDVFWQWSDRRYRIATWPEEPVVLPEHLRRYQHVMRCHHGTQWERDRHWCVVDKIRKHCRMVSLSGMNTVSMFGETSPFHANTELNYRALSYFGDNPLASNEEFAEDVMRELLGCSADCAMQYLQFADFVTIPEKIPDAVNEISKIIKSVSGNFEALRRWMYLGSFLSAFYFEHMQQIKALKHGQIDLDLL